MQKTMLAAVYHGLGDLRLEERPVPVLKEPGDAIVKVTQIGRASCRERV